MPVIPTEIERKSIPTQVKDSELVIQKRREIVEAAVGLFIRKGYHQTTTREIAREAGFSIGSLYEYIASKEDVLYLVCDAIHAEMEGRLRSEMVKGRTVADTLHGAIDAYLRVCDRMQDSILLIYRETASLAPDYRRYVLQNETRVTEIFARILEEGFASGSFRFDEMKTVHLMAHNIVVLGHMWAFRRWFLRDEFSLDEYIRHQSTFSTRELSEN